MNRFIFLYAIFLGLVVISCNHPAQSKENDSDRSGATTVAGKDAAAKRVRNTTAEIYAKPQVPVLCYHHIANGRKDNYSVSPATFDADMKILADSGYHSILPAQLYDYLVYNKALPEKPVMITFDDSRVEHALIAAPVMEKYGFRGVFFIMTITYNKKNYMTKNQIAGLARSGHCVGLHSWDHTMVTRYKESDWQKQAVEAKKKLEKIVDRPVEYWAYPYGIWNHKSAVELSKYFKLSFVLLPKRDSSQPLQTIRRMVVLEGKPQGLLRTMHRTFRK